jgi:hypothetical protein
VVEQYLPQFLLKNNTNHDTDESQGGSKYLRGFDYIGYLRMPRRPKSKGVPYSCIGPLHPARKSDPAEPIDGLLVPLQTALDECLLWSGQDVTKHEFVKYLKANDIFLGNIEDFAKLKKQGRQ